MTENMQHPRPSYVSRSSQAKMLRPCQTPAILPPTTLYTHPPSIRRPPSAVGSCTRSVNSALLGMNFLEHSKFPTS